MSKLNSEDSVAQAVGDIGEIEEPIDWEDSHKLEENVVNAENVCFLPKLSQEEKYKITTSLSQHPSYEDPTSPNDTYSLSFRSETETRNGDLLLTIYRHHPEAERKKPIRQRSDFRLKLQKVQDRLNEKNMEFNAQLFLRKEYEILKHINYDWMIYSPPNINIPTLSIPKSSTMTLILNLDSFIYFTQGFEDLGSALTPLHFYTTTNTQITYTIRPYFLRFLRQCSLLFEIIIFTKFEPEFSIDILSTICSDADLVDSLLCKENCSLLGDKTIKELKIIQNRQKKNILILDHELSMWPFDIQNVVPLEPFFGSPQDIQLLFIFDLLRKKVKQIIS